MKLVRLAVFVALCAAFPLPGRAAPLPPFRVGAVFPLKSIGILAQDEYRGVQIAAAMQNAAGGVRGRRIALDTRELDQPEQAAPVMAALHRQGDTIVLGAYSSALSIPAASAAAGQGMVYWEAGAVADRLTGQGLPTVFRVGASGSDLGMNSARFIATQLEPRLHERTPRLAVVNADDDYANSVADAAIRQAASERIPLVVHVRYDPYRPAWGPLLAAVRAAHPDILILASHIPDGVAFRRAFLAAHIYVQAFIGSTMAQCEPEFGAMLGREAVGVFASDRPPHGFNPDALQPAARDLYYRFAGIWRRQTGAAPTEEGLSGFSAGWALFHDVLPKASALTPAAVAAAARSMNLPDGSLPNGAGLRFATDRQHRGQNLRAAAVIWQWQGVRHSVVVWPQLYATGTIAMVPLPR